MDFSIIIVSWQSHDNLLRNLRALPAALEGVTAEVFVVDNASTDRTVEAIKADFSWVKLIANSTNLGFAKANNLALRQAKGRYLLLLNPDMRLQPNSLRTWLNWLDANPQAAICGPRLLDENNRLVPHVRRLPTVWDQAAIAMKLPHLWPGCLRHYLAKDFNYDQAAAVDSLRGSCFMIRRFVYERLGGLDERFFVWFEEVDYCRQVKAAGWQVWYTPIVAATDYVGRSFSLLPRGRTQLYFKQSMLKYFAKWEPRWQVVVLHLAWLLGGLIVLSAKLFGKR